MAGQIEKRSFSLETAENGEACKDYDDDGRPKRTGRLMTASAHIVTAVIGAGVLSLAWATAQLGWVAGAIAIMGFSVITWYTSTLLADCYRSSDPATGKRNYTYMDAVKANLGGIKYKFCALAQYGSLVGITIGCTITASVSMAAVKRSKCFHKEGHEVGCHTSNNMFIAIFGTTQLILSQIPDFHKLSKLSIVAALMSFTYSSIGVALSIAKVAGGNHGKTTLTGIAVGLDGSRSEKVWQIFQAIGDVAFAYSFSIVLIEIQDTLKSSPPENEVMKKAASIGISITTMFYALCGLIGYAAFGNKAPGNFLTGFGFYEPFWLIDFANVCVVVHLLGTYQVFCQPIFQSVERWCHNQWRERSFITREHPIHIPLCGIYPVNFFRVIWRTGYVISTAVIAMIFPFFNDFVGLIGAATFWPLTVYFPVEMYISQARVERFSCSWMRLKILSWACLIVSLLAAAGSIQGLTSALKEFKPFMAVS